MAFDGAFLYRTLAEIREGLESHIDKIYQPSKDELVFVLRKKGFVKRLYISVKPGGARIQFTEKKLENPPVPPNFCMVLRKYLSAARLVCVQQNDLERVAELKLTAANEMGDVETYRLVCELIGNQSNVVLLRENGTVLDALRRSNVETAKRLLLPGAMYEYPPATGKENLLTGDVNRLAQKAENSPDLAKTLLSELDGLSPLICREIALRAQNAPLATVLEQLAGQITDGDCPTLVRDAAGVPLEYSFTGINQYGNSCKTESFPDCGTLLDAFYSGKEDAARIAAGAHDIIRLVKNLSARTQRKIGLRLAELRKCEGRETLRIYGELLKANLYRIKSGDTFARVENYYDENLSLTEIPLDPALSPAKNADKYFKEYKKTYSAEQALTKLIEADRLELAYFDSVLESIGRSRTLAEIGEIRDELALSGYIRRPVSARRPSPVKQKFEEYISPQGYRIVVGKNNTQNDTLTTRLAGKSDMWFHTKNIPGSHVIVFCGGQPLSEETVQFAAFLAAANSQARESAKVPVDYTPVKYVKKPASAKPGMVIYTTNKTVYVDPMKGQKV